MFLKHQGSWNTFLYFSSFPLNPFSVFALVFLIVAYTFIFDILPVNYESQITVSNVCNACLLKDFSWAAYFIADKLGVNLSLRWCIRLTKNHFHCKLILEMLAINVIGIITQSAPRSSVSVSVLQVLASKSKVLQTKHIKPWLHS